MQPIKHVGVVGAGTMGHGIAQVFARSGYGDPSERMTITYEKCLEISPFSVEFACDFGYNGIKKRGFSWH